MRYELTILSARGGDRITAYLDDDTIAIRVALDAMDRWPRVREIIVERYSGVAVAVLHHGSDS
jgi:hypothetical protein